MADLQETMGTVIRRERRAQGLTLKELAARAALSVVYLGEVERGKKYPSALVLERLAEALGLTVADLLEHVADTLRGEDHAAAPVQAIGFTLPGQKAAPHATVRRMVQMLGPEEAATMAELGAFFIARRGGQSDAAPDAAPDTAPDTAAQS
jgi:transcriptional regulator with XRE-family HTH domain